MTHTASCRRLARRILGASIFSLLAWPVVSFGQTPLFIYEFNDVTTGATGSGTTSAGSTISGLTFSSFTAVGTPATPNAGGRFSFTGFSTGATNASDTFTGGIDTNEYYEFTLLPAAGFSLDLDSISFTLQRSATGIRQYSARSSSDSFAANIPASTNPTNTNLSVVNAPQTNIFQVADASTGVNNGSSLTFTSAFDALTSALTIRFYGYNSETSVGSFSIDNVAIFGTVNSTAPALFWDPNVAGAGLGGSGQWNTTAALWTPDSTGATGHTTFTPANKAIFSGTAGTVTIAPGGVTAGGRIEFESGGYTVAGGTLTLANSTLITSHAEGTKTTITAPIAGTVGLVKSGPGTLALGGANTFTGDVAVTGGVLEITADAALGDASNDLILSGTTLKTAAAVNLDAGRDLRGNGTLDLGGGALTVNGVVSTGALAFSTGGTATFAGPSATVGALTFAGATTLTSAPPLILTGNVTTTQTAGTVAINGAVTLGNTTRTVTVADGSAAIDLVFGGNLTNTGTGSRLHKLGEGTLDLLGNNSGLAGGVRLGVAGAVPAPGGTLIIHDAAGLGLGQFQFNAGTLQNASPTPLTGANAIAASVTLSIGGGQLAGGAGFTGSDIEFLGAASLFKAAELMDHRITVANNVTFTGAFGVSTGTGTTSGLTFAGTGSVTLAAAENPITDPILVEGPALVVNGSLSAATVTVKAGALRGGTPSPEVSGGIAGIVTLGDDLGDDDALLAPGVNSIDTLKVGGLSLLSDARFVFQIESAGLISDKVISLGDVNLGAGATLVITDLGSTVLAAGTSFTLIDNRNSNGTFITGAFAGLGETTQFTVGANIFELDYNAGDRGDDLVLRVVPEPSAAASLAGALAVLGLIRRRKR